MRQALCWGLAILIGLAGHHFAAPSGPVRADDAKIEAKAEGDGGVAKDEEYYRLMQVLADTFEQIERNYVKEVDRRKLVEAAIRGMMQPLEDPYSNFIAPDDLSDFNRVIDQEFGGIGIQVGLDPQTRRLTVLSPLPGSPAHKAGIKAGDTIMEIEGRTTEGMSLEDAVKVMKGPPGEIVKVSVQHVGSKQIELLEVTREIIMLNTVLGDVYKPDETWNYFLDADKKIAYIRITSFSRKTTDELRAALDELQAAGMKSLIIDLRNNPGGLLSAAVEIADLFLDEGTIVSTKGRNTEEKTFSAHRRGTFSGFPMAVLVNRYSASASEILSAALQDHKRAIVVGERTWGKGSVQNVIQLEEGRSALKLTTSSYHRPSGKNIHRFPNSTEKDEWGVMPSEGFAVKFSNEELSRYLEYRRQRDILTKDGPAKSDFVDGQLAKAVDYIIAEMAKAGTAEKKAGDSKPEEKAAAASPAPSGSAVNPRESLPRVHGDLLPSSI